MKKVLLNPNPTRDTNLECTKNVVKFFNDHNVKTYIPNTVEGAHTTGATLSDFDEIAKEVDMIISFGGDGTLLHTANRVSHLGVPILGINIGRVGYMAELESNELDYLKNVLDGNFELEERMMIDVSVRRDDKIVYSKVGLNDAVIVKTGVTMTIDMDIYADKSFISHYSGDGVIIATPTGSTAYSMSAGGPIIDPMSRNITITPVCTHTLTAKPIVLSFRRIINVVAQNLQNAAIAVSVDGDIGFELMHGDSVTIKTSDKVTRLIHVKNTNFYDVLYTKLSDRRYD